MQCNRHPENEEDAAASREIRWYNTTTKSEKVKRSLVNFQLVLTRSFVVSTAVWEKTEHTTACYVSINAQGYLKRSFLIL